MLDAPPRLDAQGLTFFRARKGGDWSSLTLPRTFFGRSHLERASFYDSDLTESVLAWSDFVEVTFAACVLVRADLRASVFQECSFKGADLRGADLRLADLASSDFTDARLDGAVVERGAWWLSRLTETQRAVLTVTG